MKKVIVLMIFFISFIGNVKGFSIDVDKIEVNSKAKMLMGNLDESYKIDVDNFNKDIIDDKEVNELVYDLVKVSVDTLDKQKKKEELVKYLFVSNSNGFDTLTGSMAIDLYVDKIASYEIDAKYIKDVRTTKFNDNDVMAFVYLDDCETKDGEKDIVLGFWLKKEDSEYGLYYPWMTVSDDLESYFNQVVKKEDNGDIIGGSYTKISLYGKEEPVSSEKLSELYKKNKDSVVQVSAMKENGLESYGSGFFISDGVIVTGVVALQSDLDVVVLKLAENVGESVTFGKSTSLKSNDKLFMINSKVNSGFSINYGTFLEANNGRLKNMFLINESDIGACLFNENGEVVGINTQDLLNSELSYANSTEYLVKLQEIFNKQGYYKINDVSLDIFKENYYTRLEDEKKTNNVDTKVWEHFKDIGIISEDISLPIVKATYKDKILSLRYRNNSSKMIDSLYFISEYLEELSNKGYRLTYEDKNKKIYMNEKYKVIMKDNFNYLIILVMEI